MQSIYPVLEYSDAHAAVDFLHEGEPGAIVQGELHFGDQLVMVSTAGEIVMAPADQDYGSCDFSARDRAGNLWSFGTYRRELG
jgi:hypothetical protein